MDTVYRIFPRQPDFAASEEEVRASASLLKIYCDGDISYRLFDALVDMGGSGDGAFARFVIEVRGAGVAPCPYELFEMGKVFTVARRFAGYRMVCVRGGQGDGAVR